MVDDQVAAAEEEKAEADAHERKENDQDCSIGEGGQVFGRDDPAPGRGPDEEKADGARSSFA